MKSIPRTTDTFSIIAISCCELSILFKISLKPLFSVQFHYISSVARIIGLQVNRTTGYIFWFFTGILVGCFFSPAVFFFFSIF